MSCINHTYCSLLRQALGLSTQDTLSAFNAEDIDSLIYLAQIQGTAPLVYDQLLKADSPLPDEAQMQFKQACMQNMMLQQEQMMILRTAWDALSEGGVQPVLLKGMGLVQTYPQPYLRQGGDIDIYVGADGYHRAAEILRTTFPNNPCFDSEEEYFKHWNINVGNTAIEAHRVSAILSHPCDMCLWLRLERDAMAHAQEIEVEGLHVRVPEPMWNILFVFLHSWHHYTESRSAKMKQICDLALLIHHFHSLETLLPSFLRRNLRKLRLTQVWQTYAWIMVNHLGLPADQCPLYTPKAAKRGDRLLNGIINPTHDTLHTIHHTPHNIVLRKLSTLRNKIHNSLQLWPISPIYAIHDIIGKILEGLGRLLRGDINRKWE